MLTKAQSARSPELVGDVLFNDLPVLELLDPVLLVLHLLVLLEVLNVLGVRQVLQPGILVVVELPVVDLILIFVVAMVPGPCTEVRQRATLDHEDLELVLADDAIPVIVGEPQHFSDYFLLAVLGDLFI